MPKQAREVRWVIVGRMGLYAGAELTRAQAIARHCHEIDGETSPHASRYLSMPQQQAWAECRKRGDRAQRVEIFYDPVKG